MCISETILLILLWSRMVATNAPNINYSNNMRILKLPRDLRPGTIIYRLRGFSADPVKLTFGVKESLGQKLLDIKSASFTEADVYLKSSLEENEYNLTIFVSNSKDRTEVESTIIVTEPEAPLVSPFIGVQPLFAIREVIGSHCSEGSKRRSHFSQDAAKNTSVGFITARDNANSNLPVIFELRGSAKFAIRYVFGPRGTSKAEITLVNGVDYEKQNLYALTVLALNAWTNETVDTRNVASVDILVTIKDVQDSAPVFTNLPNVVQLSESTQIGDVILALNAEDADYGNQRNVTYGIEESKFSSYFSLNETSGVLTLIKSISELKKDIGSGSPFALPVEATEVESTPLPNEPLLTTRAEIVFIIISVENHPPHFASDHLYGSIREKSPILTAVGWDVRSFPQVFDSDAGPNGTFVMSLEGLDSDAFSIQPSKGINELTFAILVKNPAAIDYQKLDAKKLSFTIVASDNSPSSPLSARIACTVNITDVNDHYPQFRKTVYDVNLYEDSPIGTTVVTIEATDEDSGDLGIVRFTSISGPIAKNLHLDPETGIITLTSLEGIDREKTADYCLTVEARDDKGLGNKNTTDLHIKILDVNDNAPEFVQNRYDAVLNPDRKSFTPPLILKAVDKDEPGSANSRVYYEIIGGYLQDKFNINNVTGEVVIKGQLPMDRAAKLTTPEGQNPENFSPAISLKVRAHDEGIPYRSSVAYVYIHNQDYLNRTVVFLIKDKEFRVRDRQLDIERGLSSMTGSQVHIYSIRSHHQRAGEEMTVVEAWIAYPVRSTVDLRNFPRISEEIMGPDYTLSEQREVQTAAIGSRGDYDLIFWILMALVILTLIFLVVLLSCWCCCYRGSGDKKRMWMFPETSRKNETEPKTTAVEMLNQNKPSNDVKGSNGIKTKRDGWKNNDGGDNSSDKRPSSVPEDEESGFDTKARVNSTMSHQMINRKDGINRMRRLKLSRHQRSRVAPEPDGHNYSDDDTVFLDETTGRDIEAGYGGHGYVGRNGVRRGKGRFRDTTFSSTGTYVVDDLEDYPGFGRRGFGQRLKGAKRTEILYIRSPLLEASFDDGPRSVSETEMRYDEDEDEESPSHRRYNSLPRQRSEFSERANRLIGTKQRQVSFSETPRDEVDIPGVVYEDGPSSNMSSSMFKNRSLSRANPASKVQLEEEDSSTAEPANSRKSTPLINQQSTELERRLSKSNSLSGVLPGSVDSEDEKGSKGSGSGPGSRQGIASDASGTSQSEQATAAKSPQTPTSDKVKEDQMPSRPNLMEVSEKSDSDSGIGRSKLNPNLNLKNSNMMEKKSIFTIAYDGVKTSRLRSAESGTETP